MPCILYSDPAIPDTLPPFLCAQSFYPVHNLGLEYHLCHPCLPYTRYPEPRVGLQLLTGRNLGACPGSLYVLILARGTNEHKIGS